MNAQVKLSDIQKYDANKISSESDRIPDFGTSTPVYRVSLDTWHILIIMPVYDPGDKTLSLTHS